MNTFVFMSVISALTMAASTLPYHLAYATRVSGWLDMYIRKNADCLATGSSAMLGSTKKLVLSVPESAMSWYSQVPTRYQPMALDYIEV